MTADERMVSVRADDLAIVLDYIDEGDGAAFDEPFRRLRAALRQPCPAYVRARGCDEDADAPVRAGCTLDAGHDGVHQLPEEAWTT